MVYIWSQLSYPIKDFSHRSPDQSGSCMVLIWQPPDLNLAATWIFFGGCLNDQAATWFCFGGCLIDQAAAWFWSCKLWYHFLSSFENENIFFDVPSYPPSIAVRNSLTNKFCQKKWCFCIFSTKKWPVFRDPSQNFSFALFFFLFLKIYKKHQFFWPNWLVNEFRRAMGGG